MGEAEKFVFEPAFNRSVKIRSRDLRITSDAGLLLLREVQFHGSLRIQPARPGSQVDSRLRTTRMGCALVRRCVHRNGSSPGRRCRNAEKADTRERSRPAWHLGGRWMVLAIELDLHCPNLECTDENDWNVRDRALLRLRRCM